MANSEKLIGLNVVVMPAYFDSYTLLRDNPLSLQKIGIVVRMAGPYKTALIAFYVGTENAQRYWVPEKYIMITNDKISIYEGDITYVDQ